MSYMYSDRAPGRGALSRKPVNPSEAVSIRMTPELHRRFKVAAAEEGVSLAVLLAGMLDERDKKLARVRAAQASPLHRVAVDDLD